MIFELGWAALAAIFTFSIAMVVWGRNGDGSIDIQLNIRLFQRRKLKQIFNIGSFTLLILITIAVIYISFVSWKDKRRIEK